MRRNIGLVFLLACVALTCATSVRTVSPQTFAGKDFKGPVGLQLYSLRDQFKKDVGGTLDQVRAFGITNVELAGTGTSQHRNHPLPGLEPSTPAPSIQC
jgi:hypothetical protein